MKGQLSPEGQKAYEGFLSRVPGYFQNSDFTDAINDKITNDGTSQIDYKKMEERGTALIQVWSKETTAEDWEPTDGQG